MFRSVLFLFICLVSLSWSCAAESLRFGVLNQRSILLTAQLWNPILEYVSAKSGVALTLKMGKTAQDTMAMAERGEFDLVYTNQLFTPERDKLGYHPVVRFNIPGIRGQIVVRADSPYQQLADLQGLRVAFPSPDEIIGYKLPMAALVKAGVKIQPVFTGNQEASMAHLQFGHVAAAGVNSRLMSSYAQRELFNYRVLYTSGSYMNFPVMANARVSESTIQKVQQAFLGMADDSMGRKILQMTSALLNSEQILSFVVANDKDYDSYRQFYRETRLRE